MPCSPNERGFQPDRNQNADGVDLTLLRENLKLTPLERARKAERVRCQIERMHELAGVRRNPKPA